MISNSRSFSKINEVINIGDYYNRFDVYNRTKNAFNKLNNNECLVPNNQEYLIGKNQLTLKHRIGSNSRYGIIYLTTSKDYYKFATKLTPVHVQNYTEIQIAKKLSNVTLKDKCPHFLIVYKVMGCNNNRELTTLPNLIKNSDYFISVNELVSGNFRNFLLNSNPNEELIINALQQILIAILSFHTFTGGLFHNDCHYRNFLFHKIKPGGYFHYNIYGKDIYVKNLGYIWLIWDFGLVRMDKSYSKKRLADYFRILYFFIKYYNIKNNNPVINKLWELNDEYSYIFGSSDKKFFEFLFGLKDLFEYNIPQNSKIINSKDYIIK